MDIKKTILILNLIVLSLGNVYAQLSDADAKIKYQQAEDAYNKKDYYNAASIADDLHNKLGRWNPKVLFMYLKGVYKNKTDFHPQPGTNTIFSSSYNFYTQCVNRCDTLISIINKATYPPEKYSDIQNMQQYFKQGQQQHAYEKDRTPAKAIAFLNECAWKYKGEVKLGDNRYPGIMKSADRIYFQLDSPYLKIVSYAEEKKQKLDFKSVFYRVDLIDLSKVNSWSSIAGANVAYLNVSTTYNNEKVRDFWFYTNKEIYIDVDHVGKKEAEYNQKKVNIINNDTARVSRNLTSNFNNSFKPISKASDGDLLMFFNTASQQFQEGDYFGRIMEAIAYLMDYIPKEKPESAKSQETTRKNGF